MVDSFNGRDPIRLIGAPSAFGKRSRRDPSLAELPDSDTPSSRHSVRLARWHFGQQQVRDAPKCPGRHAHYNDKVNERNLLGPSSKGVGKLRKLCRAWDRSLQLFFLNEECLVDVLHQSALTTSLPFVHTARRCYRCQLDTGQRTCSRSRIVGKLTHV